jgi:hypothetical protein
MCLNRFVKNPRRFVPMSTWENGFVTFSECELLGHFWKRPLLQTVIRAMAPELDRGGLASADIMSTRWLGKMEAPSSI